VVFHSFTLIASGIFLLAIALIGQVFRGGGSEWGGVVATSLIFAAILAVAVTLTSGSARSRIKAVVVENFFSNRYDYRREWMRCIDALTAPDAFVALHKRSERPPRWWTARLGRCSCDRRSMSASNGRDRGTCRRRPRRCRPGIR
jgi:hypothetical protein